MTLVMLSRIVAVGFWKLVGMGLSLAIAAGLANHFGAGAATDAYFFARKVTSNVAMGLERMFPLLLVPDFMRIARSGGAGALRRRLGQATMRVLAISSAVCALAFVAAEPLFRALAPGFDEARLEAGVLYLRIFLLALPISAATAMTGSALNSLRVFSMPVVARLMPRLCVLGAILFGAQSLGLSVVAAAVVVGAVFMAVIFAVNIRTALARLAALGAPGTASAVVPRFELRGRRLAAMCLAQAHIIGVAWVDLAFASTAGVGAVSVLEFGSRLANMAPGVVTTSVVLVYFTELSDAVTAGDRERFRNLLAGSIRNSLFFIAPLSVALFLLSERIVSLLLTHGAFDEAATEVTGRIVALLAPLLLVNALLGSLSSAAFADSTAQHLKIIGISAAVALVVRVVVVLVLIGRLGVIAVPIGALCGMSAMLFVLYSMVSRLAGGLLRKSDLLELLRVVGAAAACGGVIVMIDKALPSINGRLSEMVMLVTLASVGALAYAVAAMLLQAEAMKIARDSLVNKIRSSRRGRGAAGGV